MTCRISLEPGTLQAMASALPYLLEYPYGCTEQTVSRFLPAVLTLKTLQNMGIEVTGIRDVTPVPHNGCRPKKRKGR